MLLVAMSSPLFRTETLFPHTGQIICSSAPLLFSFSSFAPFVFSLLSMRAWSIHLPTIPHTSQAATRLSKCCRLSYQWKVAVITRQLCDFGSIAPTQLRRMLLVQQTFLIFPLSFNQPTQLSDWRRGGKELRLTLCQRDLNGGPCVHLLTPFCWLIRLYSLIFILPPCKQLSFYFHLFLLGHHDCEHLNIPPFDGHYTHDRTNFLSRISNIISGYQRHVSPSHFYRHLHQVWRRPSMGRSHARIVMPPGEKQWDFWRLLKRSVPRATWIRPRVRSMHRGGWRSRRCRWRGSGGPPCSWEAARWGRAVKRLTEEGQNQDLKTDKKTN